MCSYLRAPFIIGAGTAATVLILATVEIHALVTVITIPAGVRNWLLWGTLCGFGATATVMRMQSVKTIRRNQEAIVERQNEIIQRLDHTNLDADSVQDMIRTELDRRLSADDLTDAMEKAFAPTLAAVTDYQSISQHLASVTPLSSRPRSLKD